MLKDEIRLEDLEKGQLVDTSKGLGVVWSTDRFANKVYISLFKDERDGLYLMVPDHIIEVFDAHLGKERVQENLVRKVGTRINTYLPK